MGGRAKTFHAKAQRRRCAKETKQLFFAVFATWREIGSFFTPSDARATLSGAATEAGDRGGSRWFLFWLKRAAPGAVTCGRVSRHGAIRSGPRGGCGASRGRARPWPSIPAGHRRVFLTRACHPRSSVIDACLVSIRASNNPETTAYPDPIRLFPALPEEFAPAANISALPRSFGMNDLQSL